MASRFQLCNCFVGFEAAPERHAPDCPGRFGAGKPRATIPKHPLAADFSDPKTVATQLREYVNNPHHIDPMSQAFKRLIEGAAKLLLAQSAEGKDHE